MVWVLAILAGLFVPVVGMSLVAVSAAAAGVSTFLLCKKFLPSKPSAQPVK
jgi:hypothetical protein